MEEKQPLPGDTAREQSAAEREKTEQELVFYYSRARRLERASQAVRELNDATPARRPSLFGTLTATKPLAFLFISMVTIIVAFFVISSVSSRDDRSSLGGNFLSFSAMRFEGSSYVVIKKTISEKSEPYTGIVDMAISISGKSDEEYSGDPPIANRRIFFSPEPEEEYRFVIPFEARELFILMRAGEEYLSQRVQAE
jgi:hypothetical protein